jgi:hypothetical protein
MSKTNSVEYNAWKHAIHRCYNEKDGSYDDYGARGIRMSNEWLASFDTFHDDMGDRPANHSLDRIDVNGHYEKGNCRWADAKTQRANRRAVRKQRAKPVIKAYTLNGETKSAMAWSKVLNISASTINDRRKRGWSDERCLSTTPQTFGKNCKGRNPNFLKDLQAIARAELAQKEKN